MSMYPATQRCPRCQNPVAPGAPTCGICGLALSSASAAPPGSNPPYPLPPTQPAAGPSFGTLPAAESFGAPGGPGAYNVGGQPPTYYAAPGALDNLPTIAGSLYPQNPTPPAAPAYPGSQPQGGYGSQPAYPGATPGYPASQPQGGWGSQSPYPANQPPGGFAGGPPTYPGTMATFATSQPQPGVPTFPASQPQPGMIGGAFAPPGVATPTPQQQTGKGLKILLIVLVALIVVGGAGAGVAIYLANRPKPTISLTSDYKVGSTYVGATSTVFHVTGQKFSSDSPVSFLLDNSPAPGAATVHSDSNGNVTAELTVTSGWSVGPHTLTAKDASDYATQSGVAVQIVNPGEAKTPGPNGAPSDSDTFMLNVTVHPQDAVTGQTGNDFTDTLTVNGQGAPAQVCDVKNDNGQPQTGQGDAGQGVTYEITAILQCSGSYKAGVFTYKETITSYKQVFSNGVTCTAQTPFTSQDITGTFKDANTFSGSYKSDSITFTCSNGTAQQQQTVNPDKGTVDGTK